MKNSFNDGTKELAEKYKEKYEKRPKSFNWDDFNSLEEYKKYLEKELNK